jgi:hypothetical protein
MKITLESTSKVVELSGVPARIWEGTTESGAPVHCYITRIACDVDDDATRAAFARELQETRAPSLDVGAIVVLMANGNVAVTPAAGMPPQHQYWMAEDVIEVLRAFQRIKIAEGADPLAPRGDVGGALQ